MLADAVPRVLTVSFNEIFQLLVLYSVNYNIFSTYLILGPYDAIRRSLVLTVALSLPRQELVTLVDTGSCVIDLAVLLFYIAEVP